jgi:hypothetical protein
MAFAPIAKAAFDMVWAVFRHSFNSGDWYRFSQVIVSNKYNWAKIMAGNNNEKTSVKAFFMEKANSWLKWSRVGDF